MFLLGYDIGSSFIKVSLVDAHTQSTVASERYPEVEMDMISEKEGWAEQHPETWWANVRAATKKMLSEVSIDNSKIGAIGISYQMHGLVLLDKEKNVLRPAIIWCDSRAVEIGEKANQEVGQSYCLENYLNSPGNFTASKLKWVKENEPQLYDKVAHILLPGDYIAMKLTGEVNTTVSGLSEGIFWNFKEHKLSSKLLDYYGITESVIPPVFDTFSVQGEILDSVARDLGLFKHTKVTYRAGDQPNNALSLGVFKSGEVAATGGTSGVVYGISDKLIYDNDSRINGFAHVNHTKADPSIGILLCINGAGIQYAWMKKQIAREGVAYDQMEEMIRSIPVGSDGIRIIPFGNGAERMLGNQNPGAQIKNLQFNRHTRAHFYRAALEGIAFSFVYGIKMFSDLGMDIQRLKVGNDNLFQSNVFSQTISNLINCPIDLIETTGSVGAAKAAGIAINVYDGLSEAFNGHHIVKSVYPNNTNEEYAQAFSDWEKDLEIILKS